MTQFFEEAGTAILIMFLTAPIAAGYALAFAVRPTRNKRAVAVGVLKATAFLGVFGFIAGVCGTLNAFEQREEVRILVEGIRESANNLLMVACVCAIVWALLSIGDATLENA